MKRLLGSGLGVGFLPVAPGTWASAVVCGAFFVLWWFRPGLLEGGGVWWVPLAASVAFSIVSVLLGGMNEGKESASGGESAVPEGDKPGDPRWFVLDEYAGQSVALAGTGLISIPLEIVISFVFFRLLDIIKPWPVRSGEMLPRGWGVTFDDLLAGTGAMIIRIAAAWLWCTWRSGG